MLVHELLPHWSIECRLVPLGSLSKVEPLEAAGDDNGIDTEIIVGVVSGGRRTPLAVLPSPQSMVMSDPLTGNRMVWSATLVVQVVMMKDVMVGGAKEGRSTDSVAVTPNDLVVAAAANKRLGPVAVTLTW